MTYISTLLIALMATASAALAMPPIKTSWYGPAFHGRTTANGETYDMYGLTAAHKTWPFGTKLLVCNPDTDSCVEVRINDRGPYVGDRELDLSYAAAKRIGLIEPGVKILRFSFL